MQYATQTTTSPNATIPGMLDLRVDGLIQDPQGQQLVLAAQADPRVEASVSKAMQVVEARLLDDGVKESLAAEIGGLGLEAQLDANNRSAMLSQRIRDLSRRSEAGGEIAQILVNLSKETKELNPDQIRDSFPGLVEALFGWLPFFGPTLEAYMRKFETAEQLLDQIIKDLAAGAAMLQRDNITLKDDRERIRARSKVLAYYAAQGISLYQRLVERAAVLPQGDEQRVFIENELLFPLGQRVIDLMTNLQVSLQRVLSVKLIIDNNEELVRAVQRSQSTTIDALEAGVAITVALTNQEQVLGAVQAANEAAISIIEGNAKRLRNQGATIHKMASGAMLDITRLKNAFGDLSHALTDVETYRSNAVHTMQQQMQEMDDLNRQAEKTVRRMERGEQVREEAKLLALDIAVEATSS